MLKLEKLELRGFKSFCDHTELDFTETITAIVGPNGCGKSNLADSITWVLGEQSARLLRGSRMEDVIFQGTHQRPPVGVAEVRLTLVARQDFSTNNGHRSDDGTGGDDPAVDVPSDGLQLTVAAGERLIIGRRLYRSGESEYLLNGRRVRLRDIQDLFAGTGLGPGHYAIIGQGHVEEILTARPYERRSVIEDAAGITKFRLRQRTIELRLQAARQNLTRIDDVIAELERQVRSLKRQAAKARRFRRFKEELRGWLARFFVAESRRIATSLKRLDERLAAARHEHAELMRTIDALEVEYREAIDASRRGEAELNEARDRLSAIELDAERARSEQSGYIEHMK
ncbi:MAG: chromosome segregation protein SMC, partial [Acidobacteria bacterium]